MQSPRPYLRQRQRPLTLVLTCCARQRTYRSKRPCSSPPFRCQLRFARTRVYLAHIMSLILAWPLHCYRERTSRPRAVQILHLSGCGPLFRGRREPAAFHHALYPLLRLSSGAKCGNQYVTHGYPGAGSSRQESVRDRFARGRSCQFEVSRVRTTFPLEFLCSFPTVVLDSVRHALESFG